MKLHNVTTPNGDLFGYEFFCPGCRMLQTIPTEAAVAGNIVWRFNRDMEKPTFTPELRTHWGRKGELTLCHACITDGRIAFADECSHELAGQTVDLPELVEEVP